jgi:hypothetical protein
MYRSVEREVWNVVKIEDRRVAVQPFVCLACFIIKFNKEFGSSAFFFLFNKLLTGIAYILL